jgi:hypothetical protein
MIVRSHIRRATPQRTAGGSATPAGSPSVLPIFCEISTGRGGLTTHRSFCNSGCSSAAPRCIESLQAAARSPRLAVSLGAAFFQKLPWRLERRAARRAGLARTHTSPKAVASPRRQLSPRGRGTSALWRCRLGGSLSSGRFRACRGLRPTRSGSPTASCSACRASRSACRGAGARPSRPASWARCARRGRASHRTA